MSSTKDSSRLPVAKTLATLRALFEQEAFTDVYTLLEATRTARGLSPPELVLEARAIQLGDEKAPPLERVMEALEEAEVMDPEYLTPLIEKAWFLFLVQDQTAEALTLFTEATRRCKAQLTEAIRGYLECITELRGAEAARGAMAELRSTPFDPAGLNDEQKDWWEELNAAAWK